MAKIVKIDFKKIEKKWQKKWERAKIFESNPDKRLKFFITVPYPYTNGSIHIGAGFTFLRGDVYARFKRMQGFNVLFPQAFHATGTPIFGAIERLKQNDKTQIETFKLYGATDNDIKDFVKLGPEYTVKFWVKRWIEDLKLAGYSADWRRTFITTQITPTYSRFIEWQYNTLRKKGYVVQGTHPVVWCPSCKSPTGDHDRLEGIGESPIEYIIIKFRLDSGEIIPCATLRPETVFGVTNIWINPEAEYFWAQVNDEVWLLSAQAIEKLKDQLKKVQTIGKIKGEKLIGKYAENPVLKNKIIILPASFVDPESATGIVMSVPSHAPYDWIGLHDLKKNPEELKKYKVDPKILEGIKPISIIKTEEFGEHPAIEVCEKMNIRSQKEKEKLEEATSLIYKKEFHLGVCKNNCGKYSGLKVSECKEKLAQEFVKEKIADSIWEVTGKVVCRCRTVNHVKILENQWFLKFSDEKWKAKVKKCIEKMKFYPEEARQQFLNTVDWLKDKACTRKTGLGTPLPWDKEWIVETLSDSTIYMAYYTIARIINEKKIPAEKLSDEVFDYVFLGKGDLKQISKRVGLEEKIIEEMRKEFEYFYPVDLRNSGKDLLQNHLTFYLFHHVAIWDNPKYWPKAIGVNGFVNVFGTKMSKSLGNIIPLRNLIEACGADLVRINIVASNEGLNDADWRDESLVGYSSRVQFLDNLISELKNAKKKNIQNIELYLQSKIQEHIKNSTQNYEEMKFRSAAQVALFDFTNDIKWYIDRNNGIENCNQKILAEALATIVKLLSPLLPHFCEEFWEKLGNKTFVSVESWPKFEERKINKKIIELEENFKNAIEDLRQVLKLAGKKKNAYLYVVSSEELKHLNQGKEFIKKQFGFEEVFIFKANDPKRYDPQNKASKAKYGKPGIYLE
jgi:leucyl-tRNA synthetase